MGKNKSKFKNFKVANQTTQNQQILDAQAVLAEKNNKNKDLKKTKLKKNKKVDPNKKKFGQKTKETIAELKKVAWPSFGKVCKTTGVVLGVVAVFTLVLLGIDLGLKELYKLLIK